MSPGSPGESRPVVILDDADWLELDRSSPVPLYFQLASRLEEAMVDGRLPPGSRLENEVSLSERLNLSRPTVRRALQELVNRGLLVRRRGIGTQVVHGPVTRKVELTSLHDDLTRAGQHPSTTVLEHELVAAPARPAQQLSLPAGAPVLRLARLRLTDGVPLAILENYLPAEFADLTRSDLEARGLYQLLRSRGIRVRVAQQRIGARSATAQESRLLELAPGAAVLTMARTAYDSNGRPVEYGRHCYRPDRYAFEVRLVDP